MKIQIQVHHQHHIKSAKLEIFCRGYDKPIWTRCWGKLWDTTIAGDTQREIEEIIPRKQNDGTSNFEIDWSEIKLPKDLIIPEGGDKPDFADGVPTVPRSPYRLKFTVSARATSADPEEEDKYGFPKTAWTYTSRFSKGTNLILGKR